MLAWVTWYKLPKGFKLKSFFVFFCSLSLSSRWISYSVGTYMYRLGMIAGTCHQGWQCPLLETVNSTLNCIFFYVWLTVTSPITFDRRWLPVKCCKDRKCFWPERFKDIFFKWLRKGIFVCSMNISIQIKRQFTCKSKQLVGIVKLSCPFLLSINKVHTEWST